jgi:HK97 family phage prohead protease
LQLAATAESATASASERIIEGLAVPYGQIGHASLGDITFAQGTLAVSETGRVKLLFQHDPDVVLGYALELDDRPEGLWGRFQIAEGAEGDRALTEAADGRRDGLSVGVRLDDDVLEQILEKWWEGDTSPTAAAGQLLEVSQVSIPAFDDARIPASEAVAKAGARLAVASGHITMAATFATPHTPAAAAGATTKEGSTMTETTVTAAAPAQAEAPAQEPAPAASPNPAATPTGNVGAEAPVYTFDGRGPSFVRDVFHARFSGDIEAMRRLNQFNQRISSNDAAQVGLLVAAVETRTTAPNFIQEGYRPDLLVEVIDKGRPLVARLGTVNLTDATPFRLPVEGDFTGIGDHTEGQAHAAEGDMTMDDVTITPGAISGAYRLSRELIDASNPALDLIALRAMVRDYRTVSEGKVVAAFAAADAAATVNVNTVQLLSDQLNAYYDALQDDASGIAAHSGFYSALRQDVDTTGRPMLATINPSNAVGQNLPGHTGAVIDGVELFKDYAVSANDAYLYRGEDVFVGESAVQTFRFDEVEGPGVVKLALWAYFAAAVTRAGSVVKLTSAATD